MWSTTKNLWQATSFTFVRHFSFASLFYLSFASASSIIKSESFSLSFPYIFRICFWVCCAYLSRNYIFNLNINFRFHEERDSMQWTIVWSVIHFDAPINRGNAFTNEDSFAFSKKLFFLLLSKVLSKQRMECWENQSPLHLTCIFAL